jgi:type I restriction enzyme S subunit
MITLQERVTGLKPPRHWELRKLKHVLRLRKGNKNDGLREKNLLSLSYGKIIRKDIENTEGLVPASFEGYQIVSPGDIVLRLTDLQNDKRSLRQGLVMERGIVTSAYDAVYSVGENIPAYWYYFLYALDISKYYYSLGGGVRQSIGFKDFPNDWIAIPDRDEQESIVNSLKSALEAIDAIVALIGGNRSMQVASDGSLLSVLGQRREAVIVQVIMAATGVENVGVDEEVVAAAKEEVEILLQGQAGKVAS